MLPLKKRAKPNRTSRTDKLGSIYALVEGLIDDLYSIKRLLTDSNLSNALLDMSEEDLNIIYEAIPRLDEATIYKTLYKYVDIHNFTMPELQILAAVFGVERRSYLTRAQLLDGIYRKGAIYANAGIYTGHAGGDESGDGEGGGETPVS